MENYSPLFLSFKIATVSTIIVFTFGVFLASIFHNKTFPGKRLLESLFLLPLVLPPTVIGFGMLILFGREQWFGSWLYEHTNVQIIFSWLGAVIASTIVSFPLMYQSANSTFKQINHQFITVAFTLGASRWKVFRTIIFPLSWPGLLGGFILSFTRALGEFGATLMVVGYIPGKTETIPMAIYFAVESGDMATAQKWVIVISLLGVTTIYWMNWWTVKYTTRYSEELKGERPIHD